MPLAAPTAHRTPLRRLMRGMAGGALALLPLLAAAEFSLPALPYAADALEPYVDAATMAIHHGRHHRAYVDALNAQARNHAELADLSIEALQPQIAQYGVAVRNNGGGHYNHDLYWKLMAPPGTGGTPGEALEAAVNASFGSVDEMKKRFAQAALGRFGSGWAWLIVTPDRQLSITTTANQDNPLMNVPEVQVRGVPVLALDLWEHAYYLKHQNKRSEYISAWWNVVNWAEASRRYEAALK